jgi:hypothetical protein
MAISIISTDQPNFQRLALASVSASYGSIVPSGTAAKPSTGVLYDVGTNYPSLIRIIPVSDSSTVRTSVGMRVLGWNAFSDGATQFWLPTVLADFTLGYTSGTVPYITVGSTGHYFYNSATQVGGTPTANMYSPGTAAGSNVEIASVLVDTVGSMLVTVQGKASGGSMDAFWYTI